MHRPRNSIFQVQRGKFLSIADAEAAVGLVARACRPGDPSIGERRHELCCGLSELIHADIWIGGIGVSSGSGPGAAPLFFYDGGWRDEGQRIDALGVCMEREMHRIISDVKSSAFARQRTLTYLRDQAAVDSDWYASPVRRRWIGLGLDQFMISIYPMPDDCQSVIGLHRFVGREPFDERDRTIVHVVWQQTEWLHRRDVNLPVGG